MILFNKFSPMGVSKRIPSLADFGEFELPRFSEIRPYCSMAIILELIFGFSLSLIFSISNFFYVYIFYDLPGAVFQSNKFETLCNVIFQCPNTILKKLCAYYIFQLLGFLVIQNRKTPVLKNDLFCFMVTILEIIFRFSIYLIYSNITHFMFSLGLFLKVKTLKLCKIISSLLLFKCYLKKNCAYYFYQLLEILDTQTRKTAVHKNIPFCLMATILELILRFSIFLISSNIPYFNIQTILLFLLYNLGKLRFLITFLNIFKKIDLLASWGLLFFAQGFQAWSSCGLWRGNLSYVNKWQGDSAPHMSHLPRLNSFLGHILHYSQLNVAAYGCACWRMHVWARAHIWVSRCA